MSAPPLGGSARTSRSRSQGEGIYQLPVGPIHAGIIEPGHFRFSAVGERVLHLDARLFFTHRGLEKLVEGRTFAAAAPDRGARLRRVHGDPRAGLRPGRGDADRDADPASARTWARVVLAELERAYNHVGDLGNICAGIGFHPGVVAARRAEGAAAAAQRSGHRPPLPDGHGRARRACGATSTRSGSQRWPPSSPRSGTSSAGADPGRHPLGRRHEPRLHGTGVGPARSGTDAGRDRASRPGPRAR